LRTVNTWRASLGAIRKPPLHARQAIAGATSRDGFHKLELLITEVQKMKKEH